MDSLLALQPFYPGFLETSAEPLGLHYLSAMALAIRELGHVRLFVLPLIYQRHWMLALFRPESDEMEIWDSTGQAVPSDHTFTDGLAVFRGVSRLLYLNQSSSSSGNHQAVHPNLQFHLPGNFVLPYRCLKLQTDRDFWSCGVRASLSYYTSACDDILTCTFPSFGVLA